MLRRLFVMVGLGVLLLTLGLSAVGAQDKTLYWEAGDVYTINDMGFAFLAPAGWVSDNSNGIAFASNKADLKAMLDSDPKTNPADPSFRLRAMKLTDVGIDATISLDDAVNTAVLGFGITESEDRIELALIGRRTVTVIGEISSGREGIATFWIQDGYLLVLALGAGDTLSATDVAYTWGVFLSSLGAINPLKLSEERLTAPESGISIAYPDGWTVSGNAAYENADDVGSAPKDSVVGLMEVAVSDLGLGKNPSREELLTTIASRFQIENSKSEEFVLGGQVAYGIEGANTAANGQYGLIVSAVVDKNLVIAFFASSSEEAFKTLKSTFLTILRNSVTS